MPYYRPFLPCIFLGMPGSPNFTKFLDCLHTTAVWGYSSFTWWRHQMETFTEFLAIYAGNSPVPGEFPTQRPVKRNFDVYFDLRPNKWLSKQSWGWWFETPLRPLWRHHYELHAWRHAGFSINGNTYSEIHFCLNEAINPYIEQILTT